MYATLTQCPLFRGLTAEQIRSLLSPDGNYSVSEYGPDECIACRDTAYSGLMIVLSGRVRGETPGPSGRTVVIDRLEAPQLIAPAFLFGGYNRLPVDVIAEGPAKILVLHRGYLFELMQSNVLVLSNFIDVISNRASLWSRKIYFLSLRSLQQKLAAYLLENTTEGRPSLELPAPAETAVYFDATRPALNAALAELYKKKLVRIEGEKLTILNRSGLEAVVKPD